MKRTPLKRKKALSRHGPPTRKTPANRLPTTHRPPTTSFPSGHGIAHETAHFRAAFIKAVTESGRCAMCERPGHCDAHHLIPAKTLKKLGLHEHLWDPRNGLPLGRGACHCHESHENRMHPVPRSKLPEAAWEFAREHGLEWRLERLYPAT